MGALVVDRFAHFWSKVDQSGGPNACWPWLGCVYDKRNGYGSFCLGPGTGYTRAHRHAYELTFGPPKHCVLHKCDNESCCNPRHLFDGTRKVNNQDRHAKGRTRVGAGERHGLAKLTEKIVMEARKRHANGETCRSIAKSLKVSPTTVERAVNGTRWKAVK